MSPKLVIILAICGLVTTFGDPEAPARDPTFQWCAGAEWWPEDYTHYPPNIVDLCECRVDIDDMLAILGTWGMCPNNPDDIWNCRTDLDRDGIIGTTDLLLVLAYWTTDD